ncbi:YHS domain-containing (seleno)protein [Thermodesulfobacteriota bacterium]
MMFGSMVRHAVSSNNNIVIWSLAVLLFFVSFLVSCTKDSDLAADTKPHITAIGGYDPVAYFTESKPIPGNENFSYAWNNIRWIFSSRGNMELFKKNPAQYAPQYNGYCAFGLSRNDCVEVNPELWAIVDGKLYLVFNHAIMNAWLLDKENYIAKADRNWQNRELNKKDI